MNLTLEIEDVDPDIFIININSALTFCELVYFINNKKKSNFTLDKKGFSLTRKKCALLFPYYSDLKSGDNPSYVISNVAYAKCFQPDSNGSLFEEPAAIETKHFLQPGIKTQNYFFLSTQAEEFKTLTFNYRHQTLFADSKHISEYNKREQHLFQQVYYEKQS